MDAIMAEQTPDIEKEEVDGLFANMNDFLRPAPALAFAADPADPAWPGPGPRHRADRSGGREHQYGRRATYLESSNPRHDSR